MRVNKLKEKINVLEAEIFAIENKTLAGNAKVLYQEISNLIDGVGDYVSADYYAEDRVYSAIPGVKNIRFQRNFRDDQLVVIAKVTSKVGYLLPNKIMVRGKERKIIFLQSSSFNSELDY